jgi:hypothetical protein
MSFSAEPEVRTKTNARSSLIDWLRRFSGSVPENASARELAKMARSFGRGDPMIERWIRQCEDEEQRIREQRHTNEQRQTAEQCQLQQQNDATYWQRQADFNYDCIKNWVERYLLACIDAWAKHQFENVWQDVFGQIIAEERHSVRKQVAEAMTTMQARIEELETALRTQWQNHDKRHTEAIEQAAQRLTALESEMTATRGTIEAINRELTDGVTKRIGDLESVYWGLREKDENQHAEQTKALTDRLTAVEQQAGDLKRELGDGHKRLGDLESAYWGQRESDQRQRNEQTKDVTDKLAAFERQAVDVSYELKEVRRDLGRATDLTYQIHQVEMRLDERRIAADEAKRGERGLPGPPGPKGDSGLAGVPGRDGQDGGLASIKKWEINPPEFTARAILTNGERMPALQLLGLFEEYQRQVGE